MFINIYKQVIKRSQNGRPFNVCISAIFERDYQKYDAIMPNFVHQRQRQSKMI